MNPHIQNVHIPDNTGRSTDVYESAYPERSYTFIEHPVLSNRIDIKSIIYKNHHLLLLIIYNKYILQTDVHRNT